MFDGINSQLITFYLILNTFLFYISNYDVIFLFLYPVIISLLILNFNGKIFLEMLDHIAWSYRVSLIIYQYTTHEKYFLCGGNLL